MNNTTRRRPILPPSLAMVTCLGACAAVPLSPGAERVMVTRTPPPPSCRFVATVVGSQGNAVDGPFTSNRDLALGAVNDLKNQARALGADYVVLEASTAGNTISGDRESVHGAQTDVTHVGNAYSCGGEWRP